MLTGLSKYFNKHIAPLADLGQIEDDSNSSFFEKCVACRRKDGKPKNAVMYNNRILMMCDICSEKKGLNHSNKILGMSLEELTK